MFGNHHLILLLISVSLLTVSQARPNTTRRLVSQLSWPCGLWCIGPLAHWPRELQYVDDDGRDYRSVSQGIDASNPLGCSAAPSLRILKYLDRICEDCYMIYRDPDVYTMCRNGCFNNRFFLGCMDVMMVSKKTRSRAASFVSMINSPTSR